MAKKRYAKLNAEMMKEISNFAIDRYKEEQEKHKRSFYDRRLRNTKLLLRNYRELYAHSESAIYRAAEIQDEDVFDLLELMSSGWNEGYYVESIKKSAARTRIIIEHVKEMLLLYEIYCSKSPKLEDARRHRTLHAIYIDESPKTVAQIALEECIDERTVYRDIDAACEKLSALIFGIDGLKR